MIYDRWEECEAYWVIGEAVEYDCYNDGVDFVVSVVKRAPHEFAQPFTFEHRGADLIRT